MLSHTVTKLSVCLGPSLQTTTALIKNNNKSSIGNLLTRELKIDLQFDTIVTNFDCPPICMPHHQTSQTHRGIAGNPDAVDFFNRQIAINAFLRRR